MLHSLDIPIAVDWAAMQDLPSRLVVDALILRAGIQDGEEWKALQAKNGGGVNLAESFGDDTPVMTQDPSVFGPGR